MAEPADSTTRRIQLLYELSLSLGRSLDVQEICRGFLETLLARKALCYGAVWIRGAVLPERDPEDAEQAVLVHAIPLARVGARRLPLEHATFQAVAGSADVCLVRAAGEPGYEGLVVERDVEEATIALFRLGEVGWLKLIADEPEALGRSEVGPLRTVVGHLANALEGALAHARLQSEVVVRRHAEEELAAALAEREAIVAGVPDMLFTADADGHLSWRSAPLFDEEDAELDRLEDLVVPEDRDVLARWLGRTLETGRCEVDAHAEVGGARRRIHFTGVRLDRGWADEPTVVGSARDVTEREREAEERREMERRMLHAQKLESLGLLAGGIAHDFNNLLVPIVAHADLARTTPGLPDAVAEALSTIHGAGRRAADLARQMLAYSGRARFRVGRVELARLVDEITLLLDVAISKKVRLERCLDPGTPPVEGDENQLRQVFMNLVTNASEAIGDAPGVITLRTGVHEHPGGPLPGLVEGELAAGRYAFAEVVDTGAGMDAETRALIFDPFFTTKFTGRGLGLAAVLGIVRSHGGGIVLATAPGEGSRFRVLVPAAEDAARRDEPDEVRAPERLRSATVLLVDDEPLVRATARAILERAGLRVVEAQDGRAAVDACRENGTNLDLVLMDLTMPRMSGVEAARELRELRPELPVVLMSGYDEMELSARDGSAATHGALLRKPFRASDLLGCVRGALEGRPLP